MSGFRFGVRQSVSDEVVERIGAIPADGTVEVRLRATRSRNYLVVVGDIVSVRNSDTCFFTHRNVRRELELKAGEEVKLQLDFSVADKPWAFAVFPPTFKTESFAVRPNGHAQVGQAKPEAGPVNSTDESVLVVEHASVKYSGPIGFYLSFDCPQCGTALILAERDLANPDPCPNCLAQYRIDSSLLGWRLQRGKEWCTANTQKKSENAGKPTSRLLLCTLLLLVLLFFLSSRSDDAPITKEESLPADVIVSTASDVSDSDRPAKKQDASRSARQSLGMSREDHRILLAYVASQYPDISRVEQNELVVLLWTLRNDVARRIIATFR